MPSAHLDRATAYRCKQLTVPLCFNVFTSPFVPQAGWVCRRGIPFFLPYLIVVEARQHLSFFLSTHYITQGYLYQSISLES